MNSEEKIKFVNSKYSLEDLEEFRDNNGFIDLSKIGIEFTQESREKKGTAQRIKYWVDFNGRKVLIRGEAVKNYSMYSELIVEEIANQLGIENAHYDLIKIKDKEGNDIYGVLSESIIDFDKEELVTLHDLIGDEPEYQDEDIMESLEYEETVRYTFTIDKLKERLIKVGYQEKDIEEVIRDYNKRLVFYLSIVDTDKHTENIAFVKDIDGKNIIRLSPNYDSEFSLLLERNPEMVDFFLNNDIQLKDEIDIAYPKIGIHVSEENGGLDSMWKDTLETICEDDEVYDYYINTIRGAVDMEVVFENVEKKINAPLPENVKKLAKRVYQVRNKEMEKVINGEIGELDIEEEKSDFSAYQFLYSLINKGKLQGIRTGEQIQVGKNIEKEMQEKQMENRYIDKDDLNDKNSNEI